MSLLRDSSILVTGGTGSFGKSFIRHLLQNVEPARIAIYSRDELKQYELREEFDNDDRLRFLLGDIRDIDRLELALRGVDFVVHAAALKQVDTAEYNPMEFVQTNILGSENVIRASIRCGVKKVVALSTDKASSPANLYGATKLTADKLFISSNHYSGAVGPRFSVVRYGNVVGSRGSVVPFFRRQMQLGSRLPITDFRMTRFWISLPQAIDFVISSFDQMQGGEIFVPRIPSLKVVDLARAMAPNHSLYEIGIRPGEKLHEEMISIEDSRRTVRLSDRFVVLPLLAHWGDAPQYQGDALPEGFAYKSDTNDEWFDVDQIQQLLHDLNL